MGRINIVENSSRKKFSKIMHAIEQAGGKIVDPSDYEQLESNLDQFYIDYNFEGKIITLHLEHYLGIFLLSEKADTDQLKGIWSVISPAF